MLLCKDLALSSPTNKDLPFRFRLRGENTPTSSNGKMTSAKLYVGGLPFRFTNDDLRELCEKYGELEDGMYLVQNHAA